MLKENKF